MNDMNSLCDKMRAESTDINIYEKAKEYALDYIKSVDSRNVIPTEEAFGNLKYFIEELPENGTDTFEILKMLNDYGSPATIAQTGGRYFGFVNGGAVPASIAVKWIADVWDQNAALNVISPVASALEDICEKWIIRLLGLPPETAAGFVSGSTAATLCGIAAARNHLLKNKGYDISKKGLFNAPPIRVVLSEEAHSTVFKALSILGLGSERVEKVKTDGHGRIDHSQIPPLDNNTLLILQAGNVNTGAFDNFGVICREANEKGAWVHVDGAFGLWAMASNEFDTLTESLCLADSWSTDAHKTLNVPYDCGIILCKNRKALTDALQMEGSYIIYSDKRDNLLYTMEMSRRARGVELWAALKSLGKTGVKMLVENLCEKARYFAKLLKDNDFEILNEIFFNQINVYIGDDGATQKFLSAVQQSGACWCGGAKRSEKCFVRISVCSYNTTYADIDMSVKAFVRARDEVIKFHCRSC
ncbi:MAG: aspartate aminotransferase family protein [Oscillospiraceae bacterium]|jgi:glutamate/tyrosine decarboxylase-like PLP-dependent enzyme|nr:aspartate aminotransferase family protein [Oscillospiraceae bacterium]